MPHCRPFLILFSALLSLVSAGQEKKDIEIRSDTVTVMMLRDTSAAARPVNDLFRVISDYTFRNPRAIALKNIVVISQEAGMDSISGRVKKIYIRSGKILGPAIYRDFSLQNELTPDWLDVSLHVYRSQEEIRIVPVNGFALKSGDSLAATVTLPQSDTLVFTIVPGTVSLRYAPDAAGKLRAKMQVIDSYWVCSSLADTLLRMVPLIAGDTADPANQMTAIDELERVADVMRFEELESQLGLFANDPAGFLEKRQELVRQAKSLSFNWDDRMAAWPSRVPGRSLDALAQTVLKQLLFFLELTYRMNAESAPVYREVLDTYADSLYVNHFGNKLGLLYKNRKNLLPDFTDTLHARVLDTATALISGNRYAEAFLLLDTEKQIRLAMSGKRNGEKENELLSSAAGGVYLSFIGIAMDAVTSEKFEMAGRYLDKAKEYRNLHAELIRNDSAYQDARWHLLVRSLAWCDTLLQNKDYPGAFDCYTEYEGRVDSTEFNVIHAKFEERKQQTRQEWYFSLIQNAAGAWKRKQPDSALMIYGEAMTLASGLARAPEMTPENDTLVSKLMHYRYDKYTETGKYQLLSLHYLRAWYEFDHARKVGMSLGYKPDVLLDSLWRVTLRYKILDSTYNAETLIWSNRLEESRSFLGRMKDLAAVNGYGNDSLVARVFLAFQRKIGERDCWNAKEQFETERVRWERNISRLNYLAAASNLDSAKALIQKRPMCGLSDSLVVRVRQWIGPAIIFQEQLQKTGTLVTINRYEEAIILYRETIQFFIANRVDRFGLTCDSLISFISGKDNIPLTAAAIRYFLKGLNAGTAFLYMTMLMNQGGSADEYHALQSDLAAGLATEDWHKNPVRDPVSLLDSYTGLNDWYREFRVVYLKTWKALIKQTHQDQKEKAK